MTGVVSCSSRYRRYVQMNSLTYSNFFGPVLSPTESLHICSIPDVIDMTQAKEFFVHRLRLAVLADHSLSFLDLENGELVQQIRLSQFTSVTDIHSWSIVGSVPKVGIWCEDGIWILQMSAVDKHLTKEQSKHQSSETIFKLSQTQVATHSHLEDVYNQYSKGRASITEEGIKLSDLVGEEGLQSPALVLAALQKTSGGLHSEAQSIVHQLCEMYGMHGEGEGKKLAETPLNQQVVPLLKQYWETHKMLKQCFEKVDGKNVEIVTNVEADLLEILSEDTNLSVELKRSQLSFLITNWPVESLKTFIRHLKIGNVNNKGDIDIHIPGPSDPDINTYHPMTKLAVEAPESACGLPLFEIVCRLLYMQYPTYLIPFIEGAQVLRDRFRDVSAFTRKKHALQLCNLAIQSLPSKSNDTEERTKVRGQLLNTSALDLIQFVNQHHHQASSFISRDVFCKPQDDLQLGQVKSQLLMLLSQEKT